MRSGQEPSRPVAMNVKPHRATSDKSERLCVLVARVDAGKARTGWLILERANGVEPSTSTLAIHPTRLNPARFLTSRYAWVRFGTPTNNNLPKSSCPFRAHGSGH